MILFLTLISSTNSPNPFSPLLMFTPTSTHTHIHTHSMGSALLRDPERLRDILSTLRRNLPLPVTCKIRLLDTPEQSLRLLQIVEHAGAQAVAIHARYIPDRPYVRALPDLVRPLAEAASVPVIYNGDGFRPQEFEELRRRTGCSSLMLARGALWNASVFGVGRRAMGIGAGAGVGQEAVGGEFSMTEPRRCCG